MPSFEKLTKGKNAEFRDNNGEFVSQTYYYKDLKNINKKTCEL